MTALTPAALAEMESRAEAAAGLAEQATAGRWEWRDPDNLWVLNDDPNISTRYNGRVLEATYSYDAGSELKIVEGDAAFIAASRTAVPALAADVAALLAYVRELEAENAGMALMLAEGAAFAAHPSE